MKTILPAILAIALICISATTSPSLAQEKTVNNALSTSLTGNVFGRMNAHRQQNGISLNWIIQDAQGVEGLIIERSWDGIYFDAIDEIPVIEGANKYQDNDVYPGYLYYRIIAVMNDGSEIASPVETVRIVKNH